MDEVYFEEQDQYKQSFQKAFNFLQSNKNNLTLVYLYSVQSDHAGHGFGWMTPQYIKAIEDADVEIGLLVEN